MSTIETNEKQVRVLLVDDEEAILNLYLAILKPRSVRLPGQELKTFSQNESFNGMLLEVITCRDAESALKAVAEPQAQPFSVAFIDINLGAGSEDGITLAQKIRQLDQDLEIVLITGNSSLNLTEIIATIPPPEKLFFLNKPFKAIEIRQFVNSLSAKWSLQKKLYAIQANLEDKKNLAEEALRQSEDNFRHIILENTDAIIIVAFNGRIQYANPATESLFGRRADELLQTQFDFPLLPGTKSEVTVKRKDKGDVICEMHVTTTLWQAERAYLVTMRDISEHKELESRLRAIITKNEIVMKATIQVIARFLEMKDPYTAGHQKRVAELALALAEELGLDEHEQEGIFLAAMIHDIGKISIPSEILSKPGKLNDIEYELIKTHSLIGYNILKEIDFPWPLAQIVLQHHEKLDGSGYPHGVKGDTIHPLTKILTVADVMEAIISHRPYRAALGLEKGLEHIETNAGILYDPDVVKICGDLFKVQNFQFKTKGLQARKYHKEDST